MAELSGEKIADRKDERLEFKQLLRFETSTRLLVISDGERTGKSTLLKSMWYDCQYRLGVPVSLVRLGDKTLTSAYDVVRKVAGDLRVRTRLPRFDRLNGALATSDWSAFAGSASGSVNLSGATVSGGLVAGTYINGPQFQLAPPPPAQWSEDQREVARQQCVTAFIDDLREAADAKPVAVLFDDLPWPDDRDRPGLTDSLMLGLLEPLCCSGDPPARVLVVLAGNNIPTYEETRFAPYVRSHTPPPLSTADLPELLDLHQIVLTPAQYEPFLRLFESRRYSISGLVTLAEAIIGRA